VCVFCKTWCLRVHSLVHFLHSNPQYQDSSTSVGANYRAARRAKSHADFTYKIGIVSEEADECIYWLKRMMNANIRSTTASVECLLNKAEQLARIFGASHRTALRRRKRRGQ